MAGKSWPNCRSADPTRRLTNYPQPAGKTLLSLSNHLRDSTCLRPNTLKGFIPYDGVCKA